MAKKAQARGVTDEAGMNQTATEKGVDPAVFGPAVQERVKRMGQSMVVGQQIRAAPGHRARLHLPPRPTQGADDSYSRTAAARSETTLDEPAGSMVTP